MKRLIFIYVLVLLGSTLSLAGPGKFAYQGQIITPTGQALEANSVSFKIEILSPSPELCVLYEESHTLNMTDSNGIFALTIGEGTRPAGADYQDITSLNDALDNSIGLVTPTDCVAGPTYTADPSDGRKLRVTFDDGSGPVTLAQDHNIVSVPYATNASSVDGLTAADLLQIRDDASFQLNQSNLEFVFSNANWTELQALLDGSSASFGGGSPSTDVDNNNQKIVNLADPNPATPTDAVNVRYANSYIGGQAVNAADLGALAPGNANEVLTWSGTEWISTGVPEDTDKLEKTGDTMSGTLNMGNQDITNVKDLTVNNDASVGNNLSVTAAATVGTSLTVTGGIGVGTGVNSAGPINLSNENEIQLAEATGNGTNYVGFKAPATLAGDVIWTLPDALGTNGQFLQTDAAGNLTWATVNAGVTDFNGRTGAITPLASDYDANQVDFDNTYGGNVAAVEVQAAIEELDGEKIAKAGDAMTGNLTMDLNTGVTTELRFQDTGTKYVGFKAPNVITEAASFVWTLPVADGGAGQVLQTSGAGVLSWVDQPSGYADATTDMIAGSGLTGGGDLSADRTFNIGAGNGITVNANDITVTAGNGISVDGTGVNVDIVGTADKAAVAVNADTLLISDSEDSNDLKEITRQNFVLNETEVDSMVSNNGYLVDGGNTTGSAVIVGTNNAQNLELETNNSTAMTIDSSGSIGIGTTTATSLLTIQSDGTGDLLSVSDSTTEVFAINDGGDIFVSENAQLGTLANSSVGSGISFIGSNNASTVNFLTSSSTKRGQFSHISGFVAGSGVGYNFSSSTSVDYNNVDLSLKRDAAGVLAQRNLTNAQEHRIYNTYDGANDEFVSLGYLNNLNTFTIESEAVGTGVARDIVILGGKVGIGTTTPDTILEIDGTLKLADGSETCSAGVDGGMIRYNGGNLQFCNGSSWQTLGVSGAGLTSLGGQTGNTQTFAVDASGTAPAINSATDTHTLSIPLASGAGVTSGTISKTDYDSFTGKLDAVAGESLNSAQFWVGDGTNAAAAVTMSGDATMTNAGVVTISESDPGLQTLTTAEVDQLENINTETITNTQWGYLGAMSGQPLEAEADTLATVTGRGASTATDITLLTEGEMRFGDTTGGEYVAIKALADITSNYTLTLPPNDGNNLEVLQTDGNGVLTWVPQSSGSDDLGDHTATQNLDLADNLIINVNRGTAAAPSLSFDSDTNTGLFSPGPDLLSLSTAGSEALSIDASGNVGIGTTTPNYPFHLFGFSGDDIAVQSATGEAANMLLRSDGGDSKIEFAVDGSTSDWTIGGDFSDSEKFKISTGGAFGDPKLTIDSSGNVGIGTANPTSDLTVIDNSSTAEMTVSGVDGTNVGVINTSASNIGASVQMVKYGTSGTPGAGDYLGSLSFNGGDSSWGWLSGAYFRALIEGTPTDTSMPTALTFGTTPTGTVTTIERMRINQAGSVGIGTTTPDTILEIDGTLKLADGSETCSAGADGGMIRYNGGNLQFCNGSSWQTLGVSGAGLTSLGGQTGNTQTFAVDASGTAPAINSATDTHTLSIPLASGAGVTSGTISKTDYDSFAGKLDAVAGETLNSAQFWVGDGTNAAAAVTMSGDATMTNAGVVTISESDPGLQTLTTAEVDQLENIDTETITNTQWGYLGAMSGQPLEAEADTLATVTGRGASTATDITLLTEGEMRFGDTTGGEYVAIKSLADIASNYTLTLPPNDGNSGEVLRTDGNGVLTWVAQSGGSDDLGDHTATQNLDLADNLIINVNRGTAAAPSLSYDSDTNTGLFSPGPDLLSLTTAGSEALSIDATGNIGIGTTSPGGKLDVDGDVRMLGSTSGHTGFQAPAVAPDLIYTLPTGDGSNGDVLSTNGSGVLSWTSAGSSANSLDAADGSPTNVVFVDNGGKVGINNTSPTHNLHFKVGANDSLVATSTGRIGLNVLNPEGPIHIKNGGHTFLLGRTDNKMTFGSTTLDGSLDFDFNGKIGANEYCDEAGNNCIDWSTFTYGDPHSLDAADGSPTDVVYIGNSGNIGLGTNNPTQPLHVRVSGTDDMVIQADGDIGFGTNNPEGPFHVRANGSHSIVVRAYNQIAFGSNSVTGTLNYDFTGKLGASELCDENGSNCIDLSTFTFGDGHSLDAADGAPVDALFANNEGKIGIGTVSPGGKLDVDGDIRMLGSTSGYTGFQAPATAPNLVYTLPTADGGNGEFLTTNGSGVLSWTSVSGADDLGDHTATANVQLNDNWLSNDGGAEGIRILDNGNVGIGTDAPQSALEVNGAIRNTSSVSNGTTTIDFAASNLQYTTSDCDTFNLHNLKDGGTYSFAVQGTTSALCVFNAYSDAGSTALTVHLPSGHGSTVDGEHTVYSIMVMGTHAYFAWVTEFD